MITNLRKAKSGLSELVERASRGEEVVITVHGKAKAKLCPVSENTDDAESNSVWATQLEEARARYRAVPAKKGADTQKFWDEMREGR